MHAKLLHWDIYEITAHNVALHGVMLRGRIRKLGLEHDFNVLCENASDAENCVRFAVLAASDATMVTEYLKTIVPDVQVHLAAQAVANPVLSKLKVNRAERYTL